MNFEPVQQKVRSIVLEHLPSVTNEEVSDEINLLKLGLNSLKSVSLILRLEEVFNFQFEMDEINSSNFRTIADITELIKNKVDR